jgi:glycosyltransferase involved in cell wall biosynthesis
MATTLGSITRAATRQDDEPLNILTFPTHERYETGLAATGHRFWAVRAQGIKDWNRRYAPVPPNYVLLNPALGERQLPTEVDFDLVLSQNKFGQFQMAHQISRRLHLPLVSLEHTLPVPGWGSARLETLRSMRGHLNLFISHFSIGRWGWDKNDPSVRVIHHGVDTYTFSPNHMVVDSKPHLLSVVNDWINRDWCCGYRLWQQITSGLPVFVVGDTPGLSRPAASVPELVRRYREAQVFLNTSLISPVPTAVLEAMACGCAVVSTATCMLPEVIENGKNGFLSNDPVELAGYCRLLLEDAGLCRKLGEAARQTILERFSMDRFVANWNSILHEAAAATFTGE